jgi:hypothetical protein
MSSEELQTLTASEPLSLEQEYEMQKTWAADEDSLVLQNIQIVLTTNINMTIFPLQSALSLFWIKPKTKRQITKLVNQNIHYQLFNLLTNCHP